MNPKLSTKEEREQKAQSKLADILKLDITGYISLLDKAYKAHATFKDKAADKGTDMHEELEKYVKWHMSFNSGVNLDDTSLTQKWSPKVLAFAEWADKNIKRFIGSEINVYHEGLFIGGKLDCIVEMKEGTFAIIDFKSSKDAYFSQFVQCALYDIQLSQNGGFNENGTQILKPITNISKYIVFPFGAKELKPVVNKNIQSLIEAARACVVIYRSKAVFEQ